MQHRHILYVLAMLCTAASGMAAQLFSGYVPRIAADILPQLEPIEAVRQVGSLGGSSFLFGWAVGAFALGWISDRMGRRTAYCISVLLATSCMLIISYAETMTMLIATRMLMGIGVGSVLAQSVVMISEAFPASSRSIVVGILINAFPMGFILAGLIMQSTDVWQIGYRIASVSMVLVLAALLVVRESDMWSASIRTASVAAQSIWGIAYRKDLLIAVCLFGSMLLGIWAVFGWMPTYIAKISLPEESQRNRALANIIFGTGNVFGGLFSGVLSNRFGRRGAAAIGYVGCLLATVLTLQSGLGVHVAGAKLAGPTPFMFIGAFAMCTFIGLNQGVLSGYIPELFPTSVRGAATGFGMNLGRVITAIGIFFLGVLVEYFGGYHNAITIFALAYIIGLVVLTQARETSGIELPQ